MEQSPYIKLVVTAKLDPADAKLWHQTVIDTLPSGLPAQTEIIVKGKPKTSDFYQRESNGSICYVVPLSRDPLAEEVKKVALAWNSAWPDGDFEIDYSNVGTARAKVQDIKETGINEICLEAAKLSHNAWINEMTDLGWSYGIKFDQRGKKNPKLLPWDQLSKKYQLQEMKRFGKLLEILHNMRLKLVRQ